MRLLKFRVLLTHVLTNYGIIKKEDLIFRFNRYNKKYYILKLLKENNIEENYETIAGEILENNSFVFLDNSI